jgi:BirA family biotin operon repressor/biotin-[acetyl-CoA-carboxylase] ligase
MLEGVADTLSAEAIEASLRPGPIAWRVQFFRETASTNDIADAAGRAGAAEGLAVFAETQTRGRGRLRRQWESRAGAGLWFSALLRPAWPPAEAGRLTAIAAVAVAEATVALAGLPAAIKWPNDIWIGRRKLAGILTELRCTGSHIDFAVVGIGINVAHRPEDFPAELRDTATSLAIESGQPPGRAALAAAVLDRLAAGCHGPFGPIRERWIRRCLTLGREVEWRDGQEPLRGRAESIGDDGALLVRDASGDLHPIHGGEIIHTETG